MEAEDQPTFILRVIEIIGLWVVTTLAAGYHELAGNVFITLSILYLVWRWWRDYKKTRAK